MKGGGGGKVESGINPEIFFPFTSQNNGANPLKTTGKSRNSDISNLKSDSYS